MTTIAELSRMHVRLPEAHLSHLQHLIAEWELLADLYFADLLLFLPDEAGENFIAAAHVRPTNSETIYREDPVGRTYTAKERPWVIKAWRSGEIVGGDLSPPHWPEPVSVQGVPVRSDGEIIALLSRERWQRSARRPSTLESTYADAGFELTRMIAEGTFPYRSGGPVLTETVRAGDGLLRFDADLKVRYSSPNAVSALHRVGVYTSLDGHSLRQLGVNDAMLRTAVATASPSSEEIEIGDVSVMMLALPLMRKGRSTGALVLVRDVSEIRRRDRLLLSKEAAIREIHHRVKNNLQTIASLLQLQARRVGSEEASLALRESVRRIRSIALVHELLSRDATGDVPFNKIVQPLLRDVEEGLVDADRQVQFTIGGDAGSLPADIATPLAVILTELLQNAVEHGLNPQAHDVPGAVDVSFSRNGGEMSVEVHDSGVGFPEEFVLEHHTGLGLRIVRTLVTSELSGTLDVVVDPAADGSGAQLTGATVRMRFPLPVTPVPPEGLGAGAASTDATLEQTG